MKIQIDTDRKEVILLESITSDNLVKFLEEHKLSDYTIRTGPRFEDLTNQSLLCQELNKYKDIKTQYNP